MLAAAALACLLLLSGRAAASTYVVFTPLDSPIYEELDTLNGLGLLDTYIAEVKPISRVEAARLVLEGEQNLAAERGDGLGHALLASLRTQLREEVGWLENNAEDGQLTMLHPIERIEAQYVFSRGERRHFGPLDRFGEQLKATEATPLLSNNDDLPTSSGSNEAVRVSGWGGLGGFLTAYGEGSMTGPLNRAPQGLNGANSSRFRLLRGELVLSLGNVAVSWGQQEMKWGAGHFYSLTQGSNAQAFPALRVQNIHPSYLPGFLRYLGPFRAQTFFGQLAHDRVFSRPWLSGQIISFKILPTFELGFTHVIMFGGRSNDQYGLGGFLGRATGLSTGNGKQANTNSQAGVFGRMIFPSLRNLALYHEENGEDNLTTEIPFIGRLIPFAALSFKGGFYLPRLTDDGLTDARFEYTIISQRYAFHSDSLYWTYKNRLMGDPIGPDGTRFELSVGRWLGYGRKLDLDLFLSARDPDSKKPKPGVNTENSRGFAIDFLQLPFKSQALADSLGEMRARAAFEWVSDIDNTQRSAFRMALQLSVAITPGIGSWKWQ